MKAYRQDFPELLHLHIENQPADSVARFHNGQLTLYSPIDQQRRLASEVSAKLLFAKAASHLQEVLSITTSQVASANATLNLGTVDVPLKIHIRNNHLAYNSPMILIVSSVLGAITMAIISVLIIRARNRHLELEQTYHKLADAELRSSTLLEMAPGAVILVNAAGLIIYTNQQTRKLFGYEQDEMLGHPIEILIPGDLRQQHQQVRQNYMQQPRFREMGTNLDLEGQRQDGTCFPLDVMLSPIPMSGENAVMAIARDVSDKRAADKKIRENLLEKEVLLKEVYHRVKNNMQIVASMLHMQIRSAKAPETEKSLREAASRVKAMALVHERLYQSKQLSTIDVNTYVHELVRDLNSSLGRTTVPMQLKISAAFFAPEHMIPLGLILNELLTNAIKYAGDTDGGQVCVTFTELAPQHYQLTVQDNGPGMPPEIDPLTTPSLGLKLVRTLTKQLGGDLQFGYDNGAVVTVQFRLRQAQDSAD